MSKDEVDCEDPENADHPDCQCDFDDGDRQYDAWADERVIQFYERMEGRADLYKQLLIQHARIPNTIIDTFSVPSFPVKLLPSPAQFDKVNKWLYNKEIHCVVKKSIV